MKHNCIKNVFLASFMLAGFLTTTAQESRSLKRIKMVESSKSSLEKAPEILRKKLQLSSNDGLVKVKEKRDDLGFTHKKFQQKFKGLKVEFATYTAHAKNGRLKTMNGQFYDVGKVNVIPKLSNKQAFQKALDHTGAEKYLWEFPKAAKEMDNYQKPEGELVILPREVIRTDAPKLAYKFDIFATKPLSRGYLYIDAHTGKALFFNPIIKHADNFGHVGEVSHVSHEHAKESFESMLVAGSAQTRYSGTRSIETRNDGGVFSLNDESRKVYTRNANNQPASGYPYVNNYTEFTDNDNNWTTAEHSANKDNAALDAHWGAMMTYDYFQAEHNRNSFDDNGAAIRSYVHVGTNYDNAFWNGSVMSYGDGSSNGAEGNGRFDALTSIDVAAHEIGHAVCTSTADLAYQRESGALNEGFSDIWGAAVEHFAKGNGNDMAPDPAVWLIGDEIDRRAGAVALRSMSNPNERSQPDTYGGSYWKDPNCAFPNLFNDYCGVHTNSGVLNYWFYLLTVGGSGTNDIGNNFNVAGIGMTKAAKISYRLEANYLSENSTFADAREGAIIAASDLYGEDSAEVISVINAWYAVGVGELCFLDAPDNFVSSSINDAAFSLSWDAVPSAMSYTIVINGTIDGVTNPGEFTVTGTSLAVPNLDPGTVYVCTIKANCTDGGSGKLATLSVTTTGTPPLRYCISEGNNVDDEYIGRVQIGSIDNTSPKGSGYTDHTDLSTDLARGSSQTITVTPVWRATEYEEGYGVWIDYNQDGDFSDPGETVWTKDKSNETPVSGTFTIPTDASLGATRMRVVMKYDATPTACEKLFSYGEVEDYTVVITTVSADTEAPTVPTNFMASDVTLSSATLSWDAATDNVGVVGYDVYQGTTLVESTANTSIAVSGLNMNTSYTYSVSAKDAAGNSSTAVELTFMTLNDTEAPSVPLNVVASNITMSSATLSWDASTDNVGVVGYDVYLGTDLVSSVTNTSIDLSGLTLDSSYTYSVSARDAVGNVSAKTDVSFATLGDTEAPSKPGNLTASGITKTKASLNWNPSIDNVGVVGYDIFRGATLVSSTTNTSFALSGLSAGTSYTYSVKAKDAAGNISATATVTFKTVDNGPTYCSAQGNSTSTAWIDYVAVGGMSKSSGSNGGYANFTNKVGNLSKGGSSLITVSAGYASSNNRPTMFFAVWIDFNQNGSFDNNERIMTNASSQQGNRSTSFSIPHSAKSGKTRMRVAMRHNREPNPCGSFSSGEVEDYSIKIGSGGFIVGLDGTPQEDAISKMLVYPNPGTNEIQVKLPDTGKMMHYRIINSIGKVVLFGDLNSSRINISSLNTGMYFIEVSNGEKLFKSKLMKK